MIFFQPPPPGHDLGRCAWRGTTFAGWEMKIRQCPPVPSAITDFIYDFLFASLTFQEGKEVLEKERGMVRSQLRARPIFDRTHGEASQSETLLLRYDMERQAFRTVDVESTATGVVGLSESSARINIHPAVAAAFQLPDYFPVCHGRIC